MSVFYDHLTNLQSIRPHLAVYLKDENEIEEVIEELDKALHYAVMEAILRELPRHTHEFFLVRFKENPANKEHLVYLRKYVPEIERVIQEASEQSKQRFLDAIHQ